MVTTERQSAVTEHAHEITVLQINNGKRLSNYAEKAFKAMPSTQTKLVRPEEPVFTKP